MGRAPCIARPGGFFGSHHLASCHTYHGATGTFHERAQYFLQLWICGIGEVVTYTPLGLASNVNGPSLTNTQVGPYTLAHLDPVLLVPCAMLTQSPVMFCHTICRFHACTCGQLLCQILRQELALDVPTYASINTQQSWQGSW